MKELVADTVSYGAELGAGGERFSAGSFSQAVFITVKVQTIPYTYTISQEFLWTKILSSYM